jgi:hypothetical protein
MKYLAIDSLSNVKNIKWALSYMTVDQNYNEVVSRFKKTHNCPIFGCSSSLGVFTPEGFKRGAYFLVAEKSDEVDVYPVVKLANNKLSALDGASAAAEEIKNRLDKPDLILMHATPGYEERILEGIANVFGKEMPVYGGSAADDAFEGKWFVFKDIMKVGSGFLLVGIKTKSFSGNFASGYIKTLHNGIVTKAKERVIYEIDSRPAAIVYNEWTRGLITKYLDSTEPIFETILQPLGVSVGKLFGMDIFLLSHPNRVNPRDKSLCVLTEISEGERIHLMLGHKNSLVNKTKDIAQKALIGHSNVNGSLLLYCCGVVSVIIDNIQEANNLYLKTINNPNFIGLSSSGEQGYLKPLNESRHGNLMAGTIIF